MRVGFDASPVRRFPSGVGHYAASLLEALAVNHPEHQYLVLSHLARTPFAASNMIPTQRRAFPIKEIWMQLWLPRILKRFRPDICHFTNGVAPLRMELPYVLSVHDLSLIRHPEWHPRSRRLWMRRIFRPSALRAAGILCDSEAARKDVLAWIQVDPSCVRVVPLAARRSFSRRCSDHEKSAVRKKYGLQKKFFLYVGNLEPRKNLSLLMRAFKEADLPDFDLVLAGRRAWLWRDVLLEIGRERMESKVKLLDYVPEGDLAALYQCASVFVYPSRMEGFGLPLVEAMTSETPVVTSRVEPLVSLAGDAAWLAHPDDEKEWRQALEDAASSEKERASRSLRAKQLAAQYSWERTARETLRCYEAALSRARETPV